MKLGHTLFGVLALTFYVFSMSLAAAALILPSRSLSIDNGLNAALALFVGALSLHAIHNAVYVVLEAHQRNLDAQETVIKLLKVIALKNVTDASDREALLALGNPERQTELKKASAEKAKRYKPLADRKPSADRTFDRK